MRAMQSKAILPWLLPFGLPVAVLAIAFAPGWLMGIVGLVVSGLLAWVLVPWYWRVLQSRDSGDSGTPR
jgi:membrane protein implicated in regulation of membrane protease activity